MTNTQGEAAMPGVELMQALLTAGEAAMRAFARRRRKRRRRSKHVYHYHHKLDPLKFPKGPFGLLVAASALTLATFHVSPARASSDTSVSRRADVAGFRPGDAPVREGMVLGQPDGATKKQQPRRRTEPVLELADNVFGEDAIRGLLNELLVPAIAEGIIRDIHGDEKRDVDCIQPGAINAEKGDHS
jgi:hypothetical protein